MLKKIENFQKLRMSDPSISYDEWLLKWNETEESCLHRKKMSKKVSIPASYQNKLKQACIEILSSGINK